MAYLSVRIRFVAQSTLRSQLGLLVGMCIAVVAGLMGCASPATPRIRADPLTASRTATETIPTRINAIQEAWALVQEGKADRTVTRSVMHELAWALDTPEAVRAKALEAMLWDEQDEDDSITLIQQMLPTEPGRMPVAVMVTAAADHQWTQCIPAVVRSLSRPIPGMSLSDRSEYAALQKIEPDRAVEKVILSVFLEPKTDPGPAGLHLDMRTREGAWSLLGQLIPATDARAQLLMTDLPTDEGGQVILAQLRTLYADLGVLPATGEELRWALDLVNAHQTRLAQWWTQTAEAVRTCKAHNPTPDLTMASLEALRWASIHEPAWLALDRQALVDLLAARLKGRLFYARTKSIRGIANAQAERFSLVRDSMTWSEALGLIVMDTAIHWPSLSDSLFEAARKDHANHATEEGGVIYWTGDAWAVQIYPPRGTSTGDDRRFVAPREMIEDTPTALAHIHFHVAAWRNRDYAGPSPGDYDYAARLGRNCVVFTTLSRSIFDVDAYEPSGVVVDLGKLLQVKKHP